MDRMLDRTNFRALFAHRAIVLTDPDQATPSELDPRVNDAVGQGGAVLRAQAERDGFFDAVSWDVAPARAAAVPAVAAADDAGTSISVGATVRCGQRGSRLEARSFLFASWNPSRS